MADLKCKYCGSDVFAFPENALGTCSGCGATMTLPTNRDKRTISLHNAGNYFRRAGNYPKALSIYQSILKQIPSDAEASWCSALCRFCVEYTPENGDFVPVCHQNGIGSILDSGDYLAAIAHSSGAVQLQYEKEASRIAQTQKNLRTSVPASERPNPQPLINRGYRMLSEEKWTEADALCSQAIALDPKNAVAHLGKLLAELHCTEPKALANCRQSFENSKNYQNLMKVADPELAETMRGCLRAIQKRTQIAQIEQYYQKAAAAMETATDEALLHQLSRAFAKLGKYKDSFDRSKECLRRAERIRRERVYQAALSAQQTAQTEEEFRNAAALYAKIPGWKDANVRQVACKQKAEACEAMEPGENFAESFLKRAVAIMGVILLLVGGSYLLVTKYLIPQSKYNKAEALLNSSEKELAIAAFQALGDYRDAAQRASDIQSEWYGEALSLLDSNNPKAAAPIFGGLQDYEDSHQRSQQLWAQIVTPKTIGAGGWYTVGITDFGCGIASGYNQEKQCDVGGWLGLRSVSAGWAHTAGLREDGTVVCAGYNGDGRGSTQDWRDIVDISLGQWHTVALRSNGRVIAIGCSNDGRTDVADWKDIVSVAAGRHHTLGLRADGTVAATGSNEFGQCDLAGWNDIAAICAGGDHSIGLKNDGTVIAAGCAQDGQCNVDQWENITAIAAGFYHTVGLKADGTVVATGYNEYGQCNVSQWTDIVAVAAGGWHTVGLKADGTVICVGRDANGQCQTAQWQNIQLPR